MTASKTATSESPHEARLRTAYLALMWSLSYPGTVQHLPEAGLAVVAETLLDLETTFYCDKAIDSALLDRTGAARTGLVDADYVFLNALEIADTPHLSGVRIGTINHPDRSATLVINCSFKTGFQLRVSGPGVKSTTDFDCDVPLAFWTIRAQLIRYPRGVDCFLIDQHQVVGIPRTTLLEVT